MQCQECETRQAQFSIPRTVVAGVVIAFEPPLLLCGDCAAEQGLIENPPWYYERQHPPEFVHA